MKGNIVTIPYTKILQANRKHIVLNLDDEQMIKLLAYLVESLDRRNKVVELPEWYARKMELI